MTDYVQNGTDGEDNIQDAFWRNWDHVYSDMKAANDFFAGWGASYEVYGGEGNDTITAGNAGGVGNGGNGNDYLSARGSYEGEPVNPHNLHGDDGDDYILGWGGNLGGFLNIFGDVGIDRMTDSHTGGVDVFDGGTDFDWIELSASAGLSVNLGTNAGPGADRYYNIEGVLGTTYADTIVGDGLDNVLLGSNGADTLSGGGGRDLLMGHRNTVFFETFTGYRGQPTIGNAYSYTDSPALGTTDDDGAGDSLDGGAGDDVLMGNYGPDTLNGGGGRDAASYVDATYNFEAVQVNLGTNTATGATAAGDTFISIEDVYGSGFGDALTGNAVVNALYGRDGNDTLDGGSKGDSLYGGAGDDTYYVDDSGDRTIEADGQGTDTVYSAIGRVLSANVENLILQGAANSKGTGNILGNGIYGNAGNNLLEGLDGGDRLEGGDGADTLNGGTGGDTMVGGAGNDVYEVDSALDVVIEDAAGLAGGTDTVVFSVDGGALGANVENLRMRGPSGLTGTGNELGNKMFGNSGGNLLQSLGGNDSLSGNDGNDTLAGGEGNDTLTGGAQQDVFRFATTNAGADRITDFSKNADRFDLSGGTFTALSFAANGDAILTHTGGSIRIEHPPSLTLAQWNALVLPSGSRVESGGLASDATEVPDVSTAVSMSHDLGVRTFADHWYF